MKRIWNNRFSARGWGKAAAVFTMAMVLAVGDGNPLPTFQGEPERMAIPQDIDELTQQLWESLNEENRISLYVRMVDLESGRTERRLINKNALGGARRGE